MEIDLPVCLIDFETRSFVNVKDTGAWAYAEHFTTEILCMGYKIGNGETKLWVPWLPFPQEVIDHIEANGMFEAHNVQFERAIWLHVLRPQYGVPMPKRWKDTLAVCAYRGIPLSLDKAGDALGLPIQKNKRGSYLLQTLSVPKWGTKAEPDRIYREDCDLMEELYEYCKKDVDAEGCLGDTLGELPMPEYRLWCLDQKINQRGVRLDMDAVDAATEQIEEIEKSLNSELCEITEGEVEKSSQRDRLLKWLRANGMPEIPDLKKETLENFLTKDKDGNYAYRGLRGAEPSAIRALEIRAQLAKASTKKLERMSQTVSMDGRVRGLLQYHGAGTGRWAGRLVQPQNFPRASIVNAENAKGKKYLDMELLASHIKEGTLQENYENPMEAVSSSLRGMFIADEGKVFRICDFSAIEARVTFWVAGCDVGLEVFHKSDRGESEDIYCVTASDLVGYEVKKATETGERQLGKITVLGCFEADTQVLTNRGWVRIVDVTLDDKLWDGEAWVTHEGLLYQGRKQTIHLMGIGVTPDHMMMTQEGWVPAWQVATEKDRSQKSALWWAGLRLPVLGLDREEVSPEYRSSVTAEMNAQSISQTYGLEKQHSVINAPKNLLRSGLERMKAMATSCLTTLSEICGRHVTPLCSADAIIPKVPHTNITEPEELLFARSGMIDVPSSSIYRKLKDGISRRLRSTESIMTEIIRQKISAWLHDLNNARIRSTSDVYDLLNVGPNHRFFVRAAEGEPVLCASNCGYQMGWSKLQYQAEKDYKVILEDHEAQQMVNVYREKYKEVKWLWYGLNEAAIETVRSGNPHSYGKIIYEIVDDKAGRWLACILPNGRRLWYYEPHVEKVSTQWGMKDQLTYAGRDNKLGGSWGQIRTYGGMLCLAGDTKVLTNRGWLYITNVQHDDLLWDGIEWVSHDGCVYQGEKDTIDFGGINMTPDHEVLAYEGWIEAANCNIQEAYSVGEALRGPAFRETVSNRFSGIEQVQRIYLEMSLRLRSFKDNFKTRLDGWRCDFMRLRSSREKGQSWKSVSNPWNVDPSSLLCVALNDRQMPLADTSSLEELWGPWNRSLRKMVSLREILGRYGTNLSNWVTARKNKQRRLIFPNKLSMGYSGRSSEKQTNQCVVGYSSGENDGSRSFKRVQCEENNTALATQERMVSRKSVYDLINAGPRKRFMVQGDNGVMIVHNCENVVQAISRDLMAEAMIRVEQATYPIVLTVHDEIISETDKDFGSQEEFEQLMAEVPPWAEGCPIAVEGGSVTRYQKV